jgi:hypothetical protein
LTLQDKDLKPVIVWEKEEVRDWAAQIVGKNHAEKLFENEITGETTCTGFSDT